MAVKQTISVDVSFNGSKTPYLPSWYPKQVTVSHLDGVVEFGNGMRITYSDLKALMEYLEEPVTAKVDKCKAAWTPKIKQDYYH